MLVFKILVVLALLICVANIFFTIHMLINVNRFVKSLDSWSQEIDRSNLNYIKQEFARLRIENGIDFKEENEITDKNNDENE